MSNESELCGDHAKLREALKAAKKYLDGYTVNILELRRTVDAALAAPPRNYEVGTVEEQWARYNRFCHAHECEDCPLFAEQSCELAWAQMPYREGGAK